MAVREHIRCICCGSLRLPNAFGIDDHGQYDPQSPPYPSGISIQTIGGRGRCAWEHHPIPVDLAKELYARLVSALELLHGDIVAVEPGWSPISESESTE